MCDIVWVVDSNDGRDGWSLRLLRKLGRIVDIAGMAEEEAADALRALRARRHRRVRRRPDGRGSRAGRAAGARLPRPRWWPKGCWTRSPSARRSASGGLPVPTVHRRAGRPGPDAVDELLGGHRIPGGGQAPARRGEPGYPPGARRRGVAGAHRRASTADERLGSMVDRGVHGRVRRRRPARCSATTCRWRASCPAAKISHLAVTGRLPQVEPFRETGLIIPSDFDPSAAGRDPGGRHCGHPGHRRSASAACTPRSRSPTEGPRVIEVNGRIGGFVPQTLELASPGTDLFEHLAPRGARARRWSSPDLVPTTGRRLRHRPAAADRSTTGRRASTGSTAWRTTQAWTPSRSAGSPGTRWTGARGATSTSSRCSATCPHTRTWRELQQFIADEVTVTYEWEHG